MQFRRNSILFTWIFLFVVLFYQVHEVDGKSLHRSIISYRGGRRRPPSNNNGLNQPPDYNDPYPSQYEDPYNQRSYETPPTSRKRGPSKRSRLDADEDENEEDDLVSIYTRNPQLKLLVALSTGVTSFLLTHLLLLIIFNKSNYYLLLLSSIICSSFTLFFHNNNFSHFTRSLGVFTILILQNISIHKFIPKLFRQLNAVLFLSSRKIFPPNANHSPWKYIPISEKEDLQFSMTNTLLTMIITGAIIGWSIVKPIPLFPSWLGAILGASSIGYLTTFNDCYGDLLRFIGYTVLSTLSELIIIADDVQLRSRTMIILNQLFFFLNNIDKRYHLINTVKRWISLFLIQFTSIIYSMRGEVMNQGNTNSNRESNENGNGAKRRYGASDDRGNGRRRGNRYEEGYDGDDDGADDFYPPSDEDQYPPYRR